MIKKIKRKQSQIKMFENLGVMIVFFFLLSFGLVFYSNYQNKSMQDEAFNMQVENAIKSSKRISYMPELQCSETQAENCVDYYKLMSFEDVVKNSKAFDYYFNIFDKSTIHFEELYPNKKSLLIYNNSIPRAQVIKTIAPVSIYDPVKKTYSYGIINMSIFIKRK